MRDRPGARAAEVGPAGDALLRMRHTHKMATNTSGNAGRALQFRYLTVSPSLFVVKDQARSVIESIGVKTIIYSQTIVGRRDEEEEEKKEEKDGG